MTPFARLRTELGATWTTALAGWTGLGVLSPWPNRWEEFSPLLSLNDVVAFAEDQLARCTVPEQVSAIVDVLSLDPWSAGRAGVRALLERLSEYEHGDISLEIRKWRLVLLEQLLDEMPRSPVHGLTALTEFWQGFGFPPDSPHQVQGRENNVSPVEYYTEENLKQEIRRHREWADQERSTLRRGSDAQH